MYLWNTPEKPFEDFASHPLYSISEGEIKPVNQKIAGVLREKKNEEWKEELGVQSVTLDPVRTSGALNLCSKYHIRECVISNTHAKPLQCVKLHASCTHTEINTYNKVVSLPLVLHPS